MHQKEFKTLSTVSEFLSRLSCCPPTGEETAMQKETRQPHCKATPSTSSPTDKRPEVNKRRSRNFNFHSRTASLSGCLAGCHHQDRDTSSGRGRDEGIMRHRVLQRQRLGSSLSLPVHRMEMQLIRGATETKTPRNTTPVHVSPSLRLSVAYRGTPAEKQSSSSALALQSPRKKEA